VGAYVGLVFGATTLAVSTVLAAFMGGLALGSALAGRLAQRIRKPVSTYGWIEIGIGIYALLVPILFRWVDQPLRVDLAAVSAGVFYVQFMALCVVVSAVACADDADGRDTPVLSAALLRSGNTAVTRLYGCNLVGAIIGTLARGSCCCRGSVCARRSSLRLP
jgi:spermidine synthase